MYIQAQEKTSDVAIATSEESGPEVIKLFSCSTQLRMKFVLRIKNKYRQFKLFPCKVELSIFLFLLINIKMPTSVISRKNFMLN